MGVHKHILSAPLTFCVAAAGLLIAMIHPRPVVAVELGIPSPSLPTLQAGLHAARPGDVLRLAPGTYPGPVVITIPLTLAAREDAPRSVVIDGGGRGRVVEVRASNVVVRGLSIRNSGDNVEETDACIYVRGEAAGVTLAGNTLSKCLFGIWVNGATAPRIEDNRISGIHKPIASDMGNGINLWRVTDAVVRRNLVRDMRDGIYFSVSTGSVVRDNLMHNLRFGLHYMFNNRNSIIGNVVCRSRVGLALMFSKELEIQGNFALNNEQHGILFRTILDSRIIANRAIGNGKGLFLNDSNFNVLSGNHVAGNAIGVHVIAGSDDNQVHRNNFVANVVQVRFTWSKPIHWDQGGEGNFWSDYLGWDMNRDGWGDKYYYASNRLDTLLFRYPQMKLLAASPVVQLLQGLEARLPVLRPPGVVDRHPAMRPFPVPVRPETEFPTPELVRAICGAPLDPVGS